MMTWLLESLRMAIEGLWPARFYILMGLIWLLLCYGAVCLLKN